jgi:hypothetical protein
VSATSPINRSPPGLLSLLGIQTAGQNPHMLSDTVSGSLELLQLYLEGFALPEAAATNAPAAPGFFAVNGPLLIPGPGEILVLSGLAATASAAIGAGVTLKYKLALTQNVVGGMFAVYSDTITATAGDIPCTGTDSIIAIPPGFIPGIYVDSIVGGAGPIFALRAKVSRLRF